MKTTSVKHPYNCPAYDISADFDFDLTLNKSDYLFLLGHFLVIMPLSVVVTLYSKVFSFFHRKTEADSDNVSLNHVSSRH